MVLLGLFFPAGVDSTRLKGSVSTLRKWSLENIEIKVDVFNPTSKEL